MLNSVFFINFYEASILPFPFILYQLNLTTTTIQQANKIICYFFLFLIIFQTSRASFAHIHIQTFSLEASIPFDEKRSSLI